MAKETHFGHPPRGHVALLYYDVTNDRFQVVQGDDVDTAIPAAGKSLLASALAHGYDGSAWRKLPMLWGYSDRYAEAELNQDCTAGANTLTFSTVPAGEVWRVTALTWVNVNTACSVISIQLNDGSSNWTVFAERTPVANGYKSIVCDITMKPGDKMLMGFYGCVLHDDIYGWAMGYKMSVTM